MMRQIHHVGLTVADLDRSMAFYHDTLGLPFALAPTPWFEGEHLPRALGVDGPVKLRIVMFGFAEGDTVLELLEYASPRSERDRALSQSSIGASHVAFHVADIDAVVNDLTVRGVAFNSGVNDIDDGPLAGWRWVYFKDPDGHTLELVEVRYVDQEQRDRDIRDHLASRS
jgi:catechol 2,3-dioxygenase-like lactoylglutathione lyase family enzyme